MSAAFQAPESTTSVTDRPSLLDQIAEETARAAAQASSRYMPTLSVKQFTERERQLRELKELLLEGVDYGAIPGTTDKPTLLLPGAQKICTFFGYVPHYECRQIEDWIGKDHGGEPLFYYDFTCTLFKGADAVGEGRGSCNSWEAKYRFRWVGKDIAQRREDWESLPTRGGNITEFAFAINKAETSGQYGKPADYWAKWAKAIETGEARAIKRKTSAGEQKDAWEMGGTLYRVPNDGYPDIINTCQKMGQKRAYVAATLSATGASQYFTQDLEEIDTEALGIDTGGAKVGTKAASANVAERRIKEETAKAEAQANPATQAQRELQALVGGKAGASNATPAPDIPQHWTDLFARLDRFEPGSDQDCYRLIDAEVKMALPGTGDALQQRVYAKHGCDKPPVTPAQIKAAITDIIAAVKASPKPRATVTPISGPGDDPSAEANRQEYFRMLKVYKGEHERLGDAVYKPALLKAGGVAHSNEFKSMALMGSCLLLLKAIPTPEPATPASPNSYKATDEDLPAAITNPEPVPEKEIKAALEALAESYPKKSPDAMLGYFARFLKGFFAGSRPKPNAENVDLYRLLVRFIGNIVTALPQNITTPQSAEDCGKAVAEGHRGCLKFFDLHKYSPPTIAAFWDLVIATNTASDGGATTLEYLHFMEVSEVPDLDACAFLRVATRTRKAAITLAEFYRATKRSMAVIVQGWGVDLATAPVAGIEAFATGLSANALREELGKALAPQAEPAAESEKWMWNDDKS